MSFNPDIYAAKENFVKNLVRPMLINAFPSEVKDVLYEFEADLDKGTVFRERVIIVSPSGREDLINVWGDSHGAIIKDIVKQADLFNL